MSNFGEDANRAATFLPQTTEDERPMITVAGVSAFLYVDAATNTVRVSIDLDEAAPWLQRKDRTVPLQVDVQDTTVYKG